MCYCARLLFVALLLAVPALLAQPAPDVSGHWEGTVQAPEMEVKIEVDLARTSDKVLAGTFSQPAQGVKGLPLSVVAVDGRSVRFVVKGGDAPATFEGVLAADGVTISGNLRQADYSIPFTLKRTGDARIAPVPKSPPISKELEGSWYGTIDLGPRQMQVVLTMTNQPDGTAMGTIVSPDGSGVEIAIGMTQKGANLTIEVASVGASYAGVLNAAATEIAGTWTQQSAALPLTFRRSNTKDK